MEYDKNAIGVFKSDDPEILVGHLSVEISFLLTDFLEAPLENKLNAIVIRKRKREIGLVVLPKYAALTKKQNICKCFSRKVTGKENIQFFNLKLLQLL